ncbi:MAG: glycosyltransferase family A protein [Candidatus Binataceae bacterium]
MIWASAIIPVYNGEATIVPAVESALAQDFDGALEVIVVDDGSTDSTAEMLLRFGERIVVIAQSNQGLASARNAGAAAARGNYLAFLDADDVWFPRKLEITVSALEDNHLAVLAYSDAVPVNSTGAALAESYVAGNFGYAPKMGDLLDQWWPILPSAVVIRRLIFEACGGFYPEFRRAYEDVDLWLRARERGDFEYISQPLLNYRLTPPAARMMKYEDDYPLFARRVRERYGKRARNLLRTTCDAYVSVLGYRGLTAMREGDAMAARRLFMHALRYRPLHFKTAMRLARTFMPASMAQTLTGRTRTP